MKLFIGSGCGILVPTRELALLSGVPMRKIVTLQDMDSVHQLGKLSISLKNYSSLSNEAKNSNKGIITSIDRLISTPDVRRSLGIEKENGQIYALYPASEVAKSLTRVVEDLKTERIRVGDIYHVADRLK